MFRGRNNGGRGGRSILIPALPLRLSPSLSLALSHTYKYRKSGSALRDHGRAGFPPRLASRGGRAARKNWAIARGGGDESTRLA